MTAKTSDPWAAYRRQQQAQLGRELDRSPDSLVGYVGQGANVVNVILTIVIAAVIGYVGLVVMSDTEGSTDFNTSQDAINRTGFENSSASLTGGIETSFSLIEVVFITLMLAVIIGTLVALRSR